MCAIVGSFDKAKLIELINLNSYRGSHSYSFSTIDPVNGLWVRAREFGTIDIDSIDIPESSYALVHVQAPTTEAKSKNNIHPAIDGNTRLWHNGIIKSNYVKELQKKYGNDTEWDTELFLRAINKSRDELCLMDGSFSCLYHDGDRAYLFRNSISPMFYDDELNISSTRFVNSKETQPECILSIDLENRRLYNTGFTFKTVDNPYFFGDD